MSSAPLQKDLFKIMMSALMSLFLVPLTTWFFVQHALPSIGYAEGSDLFSALWQFRFANQVSAIALISGVLTLVGIIALGAVAFTDRQGRYWSFVTGWRFLTFFCAIEVVAQGLLLVWLAFWVTAFYGNVYYPKLIMLAVIGAAMAIFYAIACIFQKTPDIAPLEGEVINALQAPALWQHVRKMAREACTTPPDYIIAGIDSSFFVTEAPLRVKDQTLRGRSLFISLPLLRLLDTSEANAVLVHELAHFRGGDTSSSAKLGPKLAQYDYYCAMMRSNGVTIPVYFVFALYRVIFEFALKRDSRTREFLADRAAATLISPQGIIHALIKVTAYSQYRNIIEQKLFAEEGQHGNQIGIADRVASGLVPYAQSADFLGAVQAANIPHPFDSHPALRERMQKVGYEVQEADYSSIVTQPIDATWITEIDHANAIEQGLWAEYEQRFASAHEQQLAYLYLPTTDAERAIVLKYFPAVEFALNKGDRTVVSYDGLMLPKQNDVLSWDKVTNLNYEEGIGSDLLTITHPEKGWLGAKTTKVKLPGISKQRSEFKNALGQYWQRHQIARSRAVDD